MLGGLLFSVSSRERVRTAAPSVGFLASLSRLLPLRRCSPRAPLSSSARALSLGRAPGTLSRPVRAFSLPRCVWIGRSIAAWRVLVLCWSCACRGLLCVGRAKMRLEEVASTGKASRVAAHSHIKGLGLDARGVALTSGSGFVGQAEAREACGLVVDMVRQRKMAGRALLLVGAPGTGKTALALGMAQELGSRVPFCPMVGSEVYSSEVKKTEVLKENFRRAIGLRIREIKDVYEGEVAEITPVEAEDASGVRAVSHVLVTLRSARGSRTLKLDPAVHASLTAARAGVGDVVWIEAGAGTVRRLGRSDAYTAEHDLEADEYVSVPKGDVHKRREVIQDVTLADLDAANARPGGSGGLSGDDLLGGLAGLLRPRRTEVTDRLRAEVDEAVDDYVRRGAAEVSPGVLFIDEAHMLDAACFSFLCRALESPLAPVVVLATNRGACAVRGDPDGGPSPHGIPRDLLDRVLIVRTRPYSLDEALAILALRAATESLKASPEALARLAEIAQESSLRHAAQLLAPSDVLAKVAGRDEVSRQDVEDAHVLFVDARTSAKELTLHADRYL